jgi:programmed cell death 6-interacting protein
LRVKFQGKWSRHSSEQLTASLTQELGKYRGILNTATNADAIVQKKFEENRRGIDLLSKNEMELQAAIPGISAAESHENSEAVRQLRQSMDRIQEIKVERETLEKQLKEVRFDMSNDFLKSMSENGIVNEEKLSSDKIQELFGPLKARVEESIKRQESVMKDVEVWNKKFTDEKQGSGGMERENTLKMLAVAYDSYFELEGNLKEGTKFYNDLTPILVRLQQKVSDFCFARQTEKEDLVKQIQQNIISGTGDNNSGAPKHPPPRPPPPSIGGGASNQGGSVEPPIPPPRNLANPYQATPQMPNAPPHGQPAYQQAPQGYAPQAQPNPYVPYSQPSAFYGGYGQPQANAPQQPYQPQFQQNYATPYPVQYPGTYPGAFPQQQFGAYPPQPQFNQQQQPPQQGPGNPYQQ